ncbi:hypothetical protein CVT24_003915 [Panaeolus cyanescens]|uniref:Uncharacterized protein n=1 Tax=Panaeolus cyanescens TaxID=181874 RepID=A0A409VVC8_9AGAR|nr:hypothetical protein CVT24_003915 [Panaeolus cyanescens]
MPLTEAQKIVEQYRVPKSHTIDHSLLDKEKNTKVPRSILRKPITGKDERDKAAKQHSDSSSSSTLVGSTPTHSFVEQRKTSSHRCSNEDYEEDDLEEGAIIGSAQRIKFESGVKPRVLTVQRGFITHKGEKLYLLKDAASAAKALNHIDKGKEGDDVKGAGVNPSGRKRSKTMISMKHLKPVKEWMQ